MERRGAPSEVATGREDGFRNRAVVETVEGGGGGEKPYRERLKSSQEKGRECEQYEGKGSGRKSPLLQRDGGDRTSCQCRVMPLPHSYSPLFLFLRRGGGAAPFGESKVAFFRPAHPQGDAGSERLAALSSLAPNPTSLDPKEKEKEGEGQR